MPHFFYTFGPAHSTPPGLLTKKYVEIEAPDFEQARQRMIAEFGTAWAFEYDEARFAPQPAKYDLTRYGDVRVAYARPEDVPYA
jgi:hypothetical protein